GFDGCAGIVHKGLRDFRVVNWLHARSNVQWWQRRQLDINVVSVHLKKIQYKAARTPITAPSAAAIAADITRLITHPPWRVVRGRWRRQARHHPSAPNHVQCSMSRRHGRKWSAVGAASDTSPHPPCPAIAGRLGLAIPPMPA